MAAQFLDKIRVVLNQAFDLEPPELVNKEALLKALELRIQHLLDAQPEYLFSLLYRLDIPEGAIKTALKTSDIAQSIAHLVFARQLEKMESRKQNPSSFSEDNDLKW